MKYFGIEANPNSVKYLACEQPFQTFDPVMPDGPFLDGDMVPVLSCAIRMGGSMVVAFQW
jgi:hypothetical protein